MWEGAGEVKLSRTQEDLLRAMKPRGRLVFRRGSHYWPFDWEHDECIRAQTVECLVREGLVTDLGGVKGFTDAEYGISDAGREWLAEHPKREVVR